MSLNDIFSGVAAWISNAAEAIWNYPIPFAEVGDATGRVLGFLFAVLALLFICYLTIAWTKQIFAALPPRRKQDPK